MGHKKGGQMHCFTVRGETKSLWVCGWSHLLSAGKLGGSPAKTSCSLCSWIANTIQGSTQCVSLHINNRFGAGFYVNALKLIQNTQTNKKRGLFFMMSLPAAPRRRWVCPSPIPYWVRKNEKVCAVVWNHILEIMYSLIFM